MLCCVCTLYNHMIVHSCHDQLQCIQLFLESLSVKVYAPMSNGFMGNAIYCCLIDLLVALTR